MMDYHYVRRDGTRVPVSKMTSREIRSVLRDGVLVHSADTPGDHVASVTERLKIELLIRELKL